MTPSLLISLLSAVCAVVSVACTLTVMIRTARTMRPAILITVNGLAQDKTPIAQWSVLITNCGGADAFDVTIHSSRNPENRLVFPCINRCRLVCRSLQDTLAGVRSKSHATCMAAWFTLHCGSPATPEDGGSCIRSTRV